MNTVFLSNQRIDYSDFFVPKNILYKDFSLSNIKKISNPIYDLIINKLIGYLPKKKYLTIDLSNLDLKNGQKTCIDPSWHVDGIDNHYLIISWGDFRTEFLKDDFNIKNIPLKELNIKINEKFKESKNFFEIDNGRPIVYTSNDIHRGRIASFKSNRLFLRLCMSDYIDPKNLSKKINYL